MAFLVKVEGSGVDVMLIAFKDANYDEAALLERVEDEWGIDDAIVADVIEIDDAFIDFDRPFVG